MTSLFVPLLFVCWSNGECTAFFDPVERFKDEKQCEIYLETWSGNLIDQINNRSALPFSYKAECQDHPNGQIPAIVSPTPEPIEGIKT
tara:strand:+ start:10340 stop:10603 length:264 start_codon:yes stop_codon:yes gene_type:complete